MLGKLPNLVKIGSRKKLQAKTNVGIENTPLPNPYRVNPIYTTGGCNEHNLENCKIIGKNQEKLPGKISNSILDLL